MDLILFLLLSAGVQSDKANTAFANSPENLVILTNQVVAKYEIPPFVADLINSKSDWFGKMYTPINHRAVLNYKSDVYSIDQKMTADFLSIDTYENLAPGVCKSEKNYMPDENTVVKASSGIKVGPYTVYGENLLANEKHNLIGVDVISGHVSVSPGSTWVAKMDYKNTTTNENYSHISQCRVDRIKSVASQQSRLNNSIGFASYGFLGNRLQSTNSQRDNGERLAQEERIDNSATERLYYSGYSDEFVKEADLSVVSCKNVYLNDQLTALFTMPSNTESNMQPTSTSNNGDCSSLPGGIFGQSVYGRGCQSHPVANKNPNTIQSVGAKDIASRNAAVLKILADTSKYEGLVTEEKYYWSGSFGCYIDAEPTGYNSDGFNYIIE